MILELESAQVHYWKCAISSSGDIMLVNLAKLRHSNSSYKEELECFFIV
jgi:hypothetical protein